jgi:hypothetical protein
MQSSTGRRRSPTCSNSRPCQSNRSNDDGNVLGSRKFGDDYDDYDDYDDDNDTTVMIDSSSSTELFLPSLFWKTVTKFVGNSGWGVVVWSIILILISILVPLYMEGDNSLGSFASQLILTKGTTENDVEILLDRTTRFGVRQKAEGNRMAISMVQDMLKYMEASEEFAILPTTLQNQCRNHHELCCFWAASGECPGGDDKISIATATPSFMTTQCAPGMSITTILIPGLYFVMRLPK